MNRSILHAVSCAAILWAVLVAARPAPAAGPAHGHHVVESRVRSVGLFKNGVAVVRREVRLPAAGTYEVRDVPEPVHGTFWIESDWQIQTRITSREIDVPMRAGSVADLHSDLADRAVTIHFRDSALPALTGRVVATAPSSGSEAWSRVYEAPARRRWGWWDEPLSAPGGRSQPRFLLLQTERGHTYVDSSMIALVEVDRTAATTVKRRRPVMLLTAPEAGGSGSATVSITYLAKGLAWAPSYRVDISDPSVLHLQQKAVIRNELEDLEDVQIQLISGYPSVQFAHVLSPLAPRTSWASFFRQLNQQLGGSGQSHVVTQQLAVYGNAPAAGVPDALIVPDGQGADLHYQPIGAHSLLEGDALMLPVASGQTDYERVVEWIVPDTRDADGRHIDDWRRQQDPDAFEDVAWDAVRFRNPLDFPMTTAPAVIVAGGHFTGQGTTPWVSRGESMTLHITKALSIRTRSTELEEPGERTIVHIGGREFRTPFVRGELLVCNHRQERITVVIRRAFSGTLLEAEGSPKDVLREEGVYSVNPRHELTWTVTLDPGEERTIAYRYSVLVRH